MWFKSGGREAAASSEACERAVDLVIGDRCGQDPAAQLRGRSHRCGALVIQNNNLLLAHVPRE